MEKQVGDEQRTRRTAIPQGDSCRPLAEERGPLRDVRGSVNPHGAAFFLWISARLNFSRGRTAKSDRPLCKCQWIRTVWAQTAWCHLPATHSRLHPSFLCIVSVWVLFVLFLPPFLHLLSSHPPSPHAVLLSFTFALLLPAGKLHILQFIFQCPFFFVDFDPYFFLHLCWTKVQCSLWLNNYHKNVALILHSLKQHLKFFCIIIYFFLLFPSHFYCQRRSTVTTLTLVLNEKEKAAQKLPNQWRKIFLKHKKRCGGFKIYWAKGGVIKGLLLLSVAKLGSCCLKAFSSALLSHFSPEKLREH